LLRGSRTKAENALIDLDLACLMVHEVAHALNVYYQRNQEEDFFEGSLIAEHGFELESRIFGLIPHISVSTVNMAQLSSWYPWQTEKFFHGATNHEPCRDESRLPKSSPHSPMDPQFAVKLCSNEFWEGEYLQRGALALLPDIVKQLCRAGWPDITTNAIPSSIRELFRQDTGRDMETYAERKYARFANPRRYLRKPAESEDEDSDGEEADDDDDEWSEGEVPDASGYTTEDMTDPDDDDNTVGGSDDEMTEVEEWVSRPPKSAAKPPVVRKPALKVKEKTRIKAKDVGIEDIDL
jgi:hypothetical protein